MSAQPALDALGNPVRRQIVKLLNQGGLSVGEVASQLPISRPAVSKHLRVLEQAGLVQHHAEGTRNIFTINAQGFAQARAWLDHFWDDALARFALVAENIETSAANDGDKNEEKE